MKNNPPRRRRPGEIYRDEITREPGVFWTYIILRFIVLAVLVRSLLRADYESAFICLLTLAVFLLPHLLEKSFHIDIPSTLEIIIFVFVFAAEILGELQCYFIRYPHWDTMLHTASGFLCAALGFSLVDLLNRSESVRFQLSPFYQALMAFCFAMTVGVLWEFVEFAFDRIFLLDMQKDTVVNVISSVTLDETGRNIPIVIRDITEVSVNGEPLGLGGYLDLGLYDTMEDLLVCLIGAVVFSVICFFEARSEKKPFTSALALKRVRPGDAQGD